MKQILILAACLLIFNEGLYSQAIQQEIYWPTLAQSDWPMIKHDPQFTGRSPYKGPQTPTVIWKKDMPYGIISGPVIGGEGNLYFGSYCQLLGRSYNFYSYSSDGELRWEYLLSDGRPAQSGIVIDSSNTIYFGSLDQYFYALNPDGTLKWRYKTGYITEILIPNIDIEGNLYITNNPEGSLLSISPDGTLNWKVSYDDSFLLKSPAMSSDGERLYLAGKDSSLYALDLDGNLVWKFECGLIRHPTLVDNNGNIYFTPEERPQYFYSLTPDKEIRWVVTLPESYFEYSTPTIDSQGNIYLAIKDKLYSYQYDGSFRWEYVFNDSTLSWREEFWQPLICDSEGTIYLGSTYGNYYYAISSDGELKWKLPLDGNQVDYTGAISKDGTLYLGTHKSSLWDQNERNLIAIKDTNVNTVIDHVIITNFKLRQNYPNPFNPATTISYELPEVSDVTLVVYDINGRTITTLIDSQQPAGMYNIQWNGQDDRVNLVSAGVYFCRLQAGEYNKTIKMVYLR